MFFRKKRMRYHIMTAVDSMPAGVDKDGNPRTISGEMERYLKASDTIRIGNFIRASNSIEIKEKLASEEVDVLFATVKLSEGSKFNTGLLSNIRDKYPLLRIYLIVNDSMKGGVKLQNYYAMGYYDAIYCRDFSFDDLDAYVAGTVKRTKEEAYVYYGLNDSVTVPGEKQSKASSVSNSVKMVASGTGSVAREGQSSLPSAETNHVTRAVGNNSSAETTTVSEEGVKSGSEPGRVELSLNDEEYEKQYDSHITRDDGYINDKLHNVAAEGLPSDFWAGINLGQTDSAASENLPAPTPTVLSMACQASLAINNNTLIISSLTPTNFTPLVGKKAIITFLE